MSKTGLNNLLNLIKVYSQKKIAILKIKFFKRCTSVLDKLFKEGFIRGYFVEMKQSNKSIYVLLKYINDDNLLLLKRTSSINYQKYYSNKLLKNYSIGFNFLIVSTKKGIISGSDAAKLNLGGFPLINIV